MAEPASVRAGVTLQQKRDRIRVRLCDTAIQPELQSGCYLIRGTKGSKRKRKTKGGYIGQRPAALGAQLWM